jgi:hypothetical protein
VCSFSWEPRGECRDGTALLEIPEVVWWQFVTRKQILEISVSEEKKTQKLEKSTGRFWWGRPDSRGQGERDKVGGKAQKEARSRPETRRTARGCTQRVYNN